MIQFDTKLTSLGLINGFIVYFDLSDRLTGYLWVTNQTLLYIFLFLFCFLSFKKMGL
jgi:hypothetical protein